MPDGWSGLRMLPPVRVARQPGGRGDPAPGPGGVLARRCPVGRGLETAPLEHARVRRHPGPQRGVEGGAQAVEAQERRLPLEGELTRGPGGWWLPDEAARAAVAGRVEAAVSTCRRALQLGASPVAIASALANKVGNIARLYSARGDQYSLASQTGLAPYVVKMTQPVARRWSADNVTKAVILVSELDAAVKGQGGEPEFAIEAAVKRVAELAR